MKSKKHKIETFEKFKKDIIDYNTLINIPELEDKNKVENFKIDLIDITKTTPKTKIINTKLNIEFDKLYKNKKDLDDKLKKTLIYEIKPTKEQQKILLCWFDLYIDMYNKVLEKIKNKRKEEMIKQKKIIKYNELKLNLDLGSLKKEFSKFKKELSQKKIPNTDKENKINLHILDYAIKDAISSFESIVTNLNNGYIKRTRLRYLKKNKETKIIKIEKHICQTDNFCSSILGKKMEIKPKLKFNEIKEVATLQYNKKRNTFKFLVKEKVEMKKENKKEKIIAIDPGCRTLLSCISNDHIIEIGKIPLEKIKPIIKKIEKIKNKKIKNKKRQLLKKEDKIRNSIIDLHNKIIRYLVNNYDTILIGNMSTKSIVENKNTNTELKKELNTLKFYQLREKLKIRCIKENKNYKLIDEYKTSMTCSNCGNENKNLGSNKIYDCKKCNKKYDRDINASKNMLLKGIK